MPPTSLGPLLRHLRKITDPSRAAGAGDNELLERFVTQRDEIAFELLVWRHQRMVRGVCRRVLRDDHEAEDAFQAAFLALVRKAYAVRRYQSVAGWLHKVAYHVALRARKGAAKRATVALDRAAVACRRDPVEEVVRGDVVAVIDEEVSRLPEKYRLLVVLCYLEGKTYQEVARQLGVPVGTLSARLTRARDLLRMRLVRRGIDVSGALLAALLCEQASSAAVPAASVNATIKAATAILLGETAAKSAIPATVAALTEGVLRSMFLGKVKLTMAVFLAGFLVAGMGLLIPAALVSPVAVSEAPPPTAPPAADKAKPVRVDDYGDPLPDGVIRRLGTLRFRHGGRVIHRLLLTPDGKTLISSDYYGSRKVCVWELATGRLLRQFPGTYDEKEIALSPDGKLLAISQEKAIVVWDLASGKEVRRFALPYANALAFSPDGKTLASVSHLWDVATGKQIARWDLGSDNPTLLSFTPDGKTLIVGGYSDSKIGLWDAASGKMRKELDAKTGDMFLFALSPDGATLATGCRQGDIPLWDVTTGKLIRKLRRDDEKECSAVAFSPNGKTLATVERDAKDRDFLRLWDEATGKELRRFPSDDAGLSTLIFSRDGKTLILGCAGSEIRLWDAATGKEVGPTANSPGYVGLATITPNGRTLAYRRQNDICLWDMAAGRESGSLSVLPHGLLSLAFSPDGKTVAAGVGEYAVNLWDVKSRKLLRRLEWDKKDSPYSFWAMSVAFSPDGRLLASADGGSHAFIRLWDVTSGKQVRRFAMGDPAVPANRWTVPHAVAFSPDGQLLTASGRTSDEGSKVRIWEVATGKELPHLTKAMNDPAQGDKPRSADLERKFIDPKVVLSPDGRMLAKNGRPKTISVWETATGRQRLLLEGHEDSTECVAFAPDGRTLASASWDDTIRLWDLDTGRELRKLTGHRGKADSLAFSADGKTLVSTGDDTTILFWDVASVTHREHPRIRPLTTRERETLWAQLAESDAAKAYAAMVRMTTDGPTTIAALKDRLHPDRPV
ncbi:MAG TPA: sigma-70 family RNA polymerase sigma factor, partial [Gemmataceae bacterium]